jgi:hypothetical protein
MLRPRAGAAALLALCLAACAATPEEQVLVRFFAACRALDSTLLNRLATVTFNPRTDGSIQTFTVTERSGEQRAPFTDAQHEEALRSLSAPTGQSVELAGLSIEMLTKQVTLEADVRSPDGAVRRGMFVVTLQRAVGTRAGAVVEGGWIVTRLLRAPAVRTSRGASSAPRS